MNVELYESSDIAHNPIHILFNSGLALFKKKQPYICTKLLFIYLIMHTVYSFIVSFS